MVLWEITVLMIVGTICAICGISAIADGILNAIDRYKSKRTVKNMKVYSEVMHVMPDVIGQTVQKMKELDKKE